MGRLHLSHCSSQRWLQLWWLAPVNAGCSSGGWLRPTLAAALVAGSGQRWLQLWWLAPANAGCSSGGWLRPTLAAALVAGSGQRWPQTSGPPKPWVPQYILGPDTCRLRWRRRWQRSRQPRTARSRMGRSRRSWWRNSSALPMARCEGRLPTPRVSRERAVGQQAWRHRRARHACMCCCISCHGAA